MLESDGKPTIELLLILHNAAMALNSCPGLDGTACQDVINSLWATAKIIAPRGWILAPSYRDFRNQEHVQDLSDLDIWGQLDYMINHEHLRPATAWDCLAIGLAEVGEWIANTNTDQN